MDEMPSKFMRSLSAVDLRLSSDLESRLVQAAQGFGIPGLALALVAPGRRGLLRWGEAVPGAGQPVEEGSWFSVASLGKHVTALGVLDLVHQGLLGLDDPLGRHLQGLPPAWAVRRIRSLLNHTSGLPEYLAHRPQEQVPTIRKEFVERYGVLPEAFCEGDAWMYSNTNYILLGFLLAQVSGCPYAVAIQTLFDRAGCEGGATVGGPHWARQTAARAGPVGAVDQESAGREVIGDGDVCFTPAGALAWLEALLDRHLLAGAGQASELVPGRLNTGRPAYYASGWFLEPLRGETICHHGGHFDGWSAMALLNLRRGAGVIAMCNLAPGHTRFIRHLAQVALESFAPGSTPLSLPVLEDDSPALTAHARAVLLRAPGSAPDIDVLAEELQRLAAHGSTVRTVVNLNCGATPLSFDLVEQHIGDAGRVRRYRLSYPERTEHVLVGTSAEGRLHWAWGL
jgi:CubicO group peptidase (beta-lactamase class C family)